MADFVNQYDCSDCEHCFKVTPFSLLSKKDLELLNKSRLEVKFKKGEIIYKQGTPLTHIVIVHTGLGKIYIESPKSKNLILSYTRTNDLNGGLGVFIDQRHHSSLKAVTDCETCFIEINAFKTVLRSKSIFMEAYLKEHSEKVLHTYHQFALLTQKNMEGRLAESILYLNEHFFENGFISDISKQDLAELTAMTKESVIRVLKEFKDDGLIETKGQEIKLLDKATLKQISLHG